MSPVLRNAYFKGHGLGNDYIALDPGELDFELTPKSVRAICDRHRGIGGDGILALEPSERAHFGLRIYNPDGSLHLIAHNIIPDDDCLGIGCYSEMDEYRFVFRDRGSSTVDFTIDQGPAPDFCDNTLRGTFRFQLVLP